MVEFAAILLAIFSLLVLLAVVGVFCHGLYARAQMKRYKRHASSAGKRG